MDASAIATIVSAAVGVVGIIVTVYLWRTRRPSERASLSAEYVDGPIAVGGGFEYRFLVTNAGHDVARDPQGWLVDDLGRPVVSDRFNVGRGLLKAGESAEVRLYTPSLARPLKLNLGWYERVAGGKVETHEYPANVPVPKSAEDAKRPWTYPSAAHGRRERLLGWLSRIRHQRHP
jgi:hypothetical protein